MNEKVRPTILLVDDEEMVLNSIKSFFAIETDYKLLTYTSPVKALEELDVNRQSRRPRDQRLSDAGNGRHYISRKGEREAADGSANPAHRYTRTRKTRSRPSTTSGCINISRSPGITRT